MVKTNVIWKGAGVSSCCSEQNPHVLQQSGDNVAAHPCMCLVIAPNYRVGELSQLQSLNHPQITQQPKIWRIFCWVSSLGFSLKVQQDVGRVLGARCERSGERRRWEKRGSTGGSLKERLEGKGFCKGWKWWKEFGEETDGFIINKVIILAVAAWGWLSHFKGGQKFCIP